MTSIPEPFTIANGQTADGDQLEADLAIIRTICNGQLEAGVNVQAGPSGAALTGSSSSGGSSGFVSRSDHQHVVRGLEQLASDPTTGNFVGREYFDTTNKRSRMCIALGTPDTWVTTGNMAATDLPIHSSRHATGGADPLPNNSVAETMFAARTIYQGVPASEPITLTANGWNDVVTGLAVTITGTQVAWLVVNISVTNPGAVSPVVTARVQDGSSNTLWQSPTRQMSAAGSSNDAMAITGVYPVTLTSSPTLKMQVNANTVSANPNQVVVHKSQTVNGSTFAATSLSVVVG